MNIQKILPFTGIALVSSAIHLSAQPVPPLTGTNTACVSAPNLADTLNLGVDDSGFTSIFDGKSLKGWWENCQSPHSSQDRTNGGIWLVDSARGLLFANQNTNAAGSLLMTNKSYGNYELTFDFWPSFGDDGGLFNRTTVTGSCYQTTLDYIQGSSVGGTYFENGYNAGAGRNFDPFVFGPNKYTITIGTNSNVNNRLDSVTKKFGNPAAFGCPATGCGPSNWTAIWDTGGWNQVRVRFFGTGASAANKVHNFVSIRKLGSTVWIPTLLDSVQFNTPAAPLAFQIHNGASSWSNRNGHWYRNLKLRPLTDQGVPIIQPSSIVPGAGRSYNIRTVSGALTGTLDSKFEITVSDLSGRILEKFSGQAGAFHHILSPGTKGIMLVQIKTTRGVDYLRTARL